MNQILRNILNEQELHNYQTIQIDRALIKTVFKLRINRESFTLLDKSLMRPNEKVLYIYFYLLQLFVSAERNKGNHSFFICSSMVIILDNGISKIASITLLGLKVYTERTQTLSELRLVNKHVNVQTVEFGCFKFVVQNTTNS